jgi:hypothetical protein
MMADFLVGIANFRYQCLSDMHRTPDNAMRIANLYRDLVRTPMVLHNGLIVVTDHGNPSGQVNTSTDDTLALYWMFAFCWLDAGGINDYETFDREVRLYLYGDDSIVMKTEKGSLILSRENMIRSMAKLGYEIEFANQFEFLGHAMSWSPQIGSMVPVLTTERILSSLLYPPRDGSDASFVFERACNLRIVSYTNPVAFEIVDSFCSWLRDRYPTFCRASLYLPPSYLRSMHVSDANFVKAESEITGSPCPVYFDSHGEKKK